MTITGGLEPKEPNDRLAVRLDEIKKRRCPAGHLQEVGRRSPEHDIKVLLGYQSLCLP